VYESIRHFPSQPEFQVFPFHIDFDLVMPRVATVFGATGSQGGSVVSALLADGTFVVRAVTRNASSDGAKKLASKGVEVVQGDLRDKASLIKALTGAEVVFGVYVSSISISLDR
jgi:putative NADH-flavin reductase